MEEEKQLLYRIYTIKATDRREYKIREFMCPDTMKVTDRRLLAVNGNHVVDRHIMHRIPRVPKAKK